MYKFVYHLDFFLTLILALILILHGTTQCSFFSASVVYFRIVTTCKQPEVGNFPAVCSSDALLAIYLTEDVHPKSRTLLMSYDFVSDNNKYDTEMKHLLRVCEQMLGNDMLSFDSNNNDDYRNKKKAKNAERKRRGRVKYEITFSRKGRYWRYLRMERQNVRAY